MDIFNFQKEVILQECLCIKETGGWSGGAKVLGKLPESGRPTI